MSEKSLKKQGIEYSPIVCIYFLMKDEEIIYVGQTRNLDYRLGQHKMKKEFDRYSYVICEESELDELEFQYIVKFDPKLNVVLPRHSPYKTLDYLKKVYGVNKRILNRIVKENNLSPYFRDFYDEREIGEVIDAQGLLRNHSGERQV